MRYNSTVFTVEHYQTPGGKDVIAEWFAALRDTSAVARLAARVQRLALGKFGDCKLLRDGVSELRIDEGPGYRLYYARAGRTVVLLLCGGTKRTQRADIERAVERWKDWQERTRT